MLVHGKHGDALYDLRAMRIRRLSKPASALLQAEVQGDVQWTALDARERDFLVQLAATSFLQPRRSALAAPYACDWQWPTALPPLRTLSFELDSSTDSQALTRILAWIREAIADYGLLSLVLLVAPGGTDAGDRIANEALAMSEDLIVETLVVGDDGGPDQPGHASHASHASNSTPRAVRRHSIEVVEAGEPVGLGADGCRRVRGARDAIGPEAFIVSFAFFHLLEKFGESHGCLHFDAGLRAFPDIAEENYRLSGEAGESRSLRELLDDARLRHYWSRGKHGREKCRDCELRLACPNPVAARSRVDDLDSAPANCGYDLASGTWRAPA
jgi:hypothetical protein